MKANIVLLLLIPSAAVIAHGQASGSQISNLFDSFGASQILNVEMITDPNDPALVILSRQGSTVGLALFSLAQERVHMVWHLAKMPEFMSVISPDNLRVLKTEDGPVVALHGCAPHLCGGKGLAGALIYVVRDHQMYSASASWSGVTRGTKIVYSPEGHTEEYIRQRELLNDMLRDEHYNP